MKHKSIAPQTQLKALNNKVADLQTVIQWLLSLLKKEFDRRLSPELMDEGYEFDINEEKTLLTIRTARSKQVLRTIQIDSWLAEQFTEIMDCEEKLRQLAGQISDNDETKSLEDYSQDDRNRVREVLSQIRKNRNSDVQN